MDNASLSELAVGFEKQMRCNCDLDNWEPERSTGHSIVCRIHKAAVECKRGHGPAPLPADNGRAE